MFGFDALVSTSSLWLMGWGGILILGFWLCCLLFVDLSVCFRLWAFMRVFLFLWFVCVDFGWGVCAFGFFGCVFVGGLVGFWICACFRFELVLVLIAF